MNSNISDLSSNISALSKFSIFSDKIAEILRQGLARHKAYDIKIYDVKGVSQIADSILVCSLDSNRQLASMAQFLITEFKNIGINRIVSGKENWIVVNAFCTMIHLFLPEVRDYYTLDEFITRSTLTCNVGRIEDDFAAS